MRSPTRLNRIKSAAIGMAAGFSVIAGFASQGVAQQHVSLAMEYEIRLAGLKLGTFNVSSNVAQTGYSMRGTGQLKFITGFIFEIKGGTTAVGTMAPQGPVPRSFGFDFDTGKRKGDLKIEFADNAVSHVVARPPFVESPKTIPVTKEHVTNVLDPMTAMFFSSAIAQGAANGAACPGRVPVFDGKQRFDLILTQTQVVKVKKKRKRGYGGNATVCSIKYVPIAGYKPTNKGVKFMTNADSIVAWQIPVPYQNLHIPYYVALPTPLGKASATLEKFKVILPGGRRIDVVK